MGDPDNTVAADVTPGMLHIEVAYALPHKQELISLLLQEGSTLQQAVEASGLPRKYPEIDLNRNKFGIYGKLARLDTRLRERDRVEIYRPLQADPKETRRRRAAENKAARKNRSAT